MMKRQLFCLCILFFGFGWMAPNASANINTIDIRILPESIVYNDYYSLGDIAELDGFDIETIQKLARLEIGKSPLPGRSLRVSHGMVRRKLNRFDTDRAIKIVIPSKPVVSRASVKIEGSQLHQLAMKEIKDRYEEYGQVTIEIRSDLKDLFLPKGEIAYQFSRIGKSVNIGGNSTWILKLLVDGEEFKRIFVRAKVSVYDEVVVAKKVIVSGNKIQKNDLKQIKKNISNERVGYIAKPKLIVGQQAKRTIYKNESLKRNLVEEPVLIKKGTPVTLIYKTKHMLLTNIVKALKEGKKGDIIPVRPLTGNRTIYAVVIDENNVEVAL